MRRNTYGAMIALALAACGTDTGNGLVTIKTGLTSSDTGTGGGDASKPSGRDQQGTVFTVESARAFVRHVEFQRPGGKCDDFKPSNKEFVKCDGGKIRVNGPFIADLVTQEATPSLAGVEITADTYNRVDIRLDEAKSSESLVPSTDPLSQETLVASGTFFDQGSETRFTLALKFTEDARFEADQGIVIEETGAQDVFLRLDVARWFSSLPITKCIRDRDLEVQNGTLTIEDKGRSCSDVENALKEAIKTSGRLEK